MEFDAWNRDWRRSRKVRSMESEIEEFEPNSRVEIGNGGVQAKFRHFESEME